MKFLIIAAGLVAGLVAFESDAKAQFYGPNQGGGFSIGIGGPRGSFGLSIGNGPIYQRPPIYVAPVPVRVVPQYYGPSYPSHYGHGHAPHYPAPYYQGGYGHGGYGQGSYYRGPAGHGPYYPGPQGHHHHDHYGH